MQAPSQVIDANAVSDRARHFQYRETSFKRLHTQPGFHTPAPRELILASFKHKTVHATLPRKRSLRFPTGSLTDGLAGRAQHKTMPTSPLKSRWHRNAHRATPAGHRLNQHLASRGTSAQVAVDKQQQIVRTRLGRLTQISHARAHGRALAALVRLRNNLRTSAFSDLGGVVGRTVINHHDPLHPGNPQGRLHGCGDALSLVIGRDDHRHRQLAEIIRILNALVNRVGNSAVRQILAGGAAVSAWLLGVRVSLQLGKFLSDLLCRGEGHGASLKSLIYRFTWREMMPALARRSSAFRAASSAKAA